MGRIAQALKRAEQERARRCTGDAASTAVMDDDQTPEPDAAACTPRPRALEPDDLTRLLETPGPQPFVVSAPSITPCQVAAEVVVFHDPASAVAERYRSARTRLVSGHADGGSRIFAVTSALPREGKTVTVANLGFSLAELRHLRVVIVDCDFRRQGLSRMFQVQDRPGLAEVIRGEKSLADVCVPVVRENLHLIPTGKASSGNPSDLLAGRAAISAFREINDRFHYGLIDTPPTNTTADIGLVAPLCHGVVIVLRMGRTPEHLLRRCVRTLQANHVAIAGSILVGYCEKTMAYMDTHDDEEVHS